MTSCYYLNKCVMAKLTPTCNTSNHLYCGLYIRRTQESMLGKAMSKFYGRTEWEGIEGDCRLSEILGGGE